MISQPPTTPPIKGRGQKQSSFDKYSQDLLENLSDSDWEKQNDAIEQLIQHGSKEAIRNSLRKSVSSLLECAQSTRTALAKNALNLILLWIEDKEIPVSSISDVMGTRLLKLLQQQSSHHFIVDLAGKCFLALLENISEQKICAIISRESKSPFAPARSMVANGALCSIKKISDHVPLLLPLAILGKDADQNARKFSRLAVKEIASTKNDFEEFVKNNVSSQEDQLLLIKMSKTP